MATLNNPPVVPKMVSRVLKIGLPQNGPTMKSNIDTIMEDGWILVTSYYDTSRDEVRFIFTRPKRQK